MDEKIRFDSIIKKNLSHVELRALTPISPDQLTYQCHSITRTEFCSFLKILAYRQTFSLSKILLLFIQNGGWSFRRRWGRVRQSAVAPHLTKILLTAEHKARRSRAAPSQCSCFCLCRGWRSTWLGLLSGLLWVRIYRRCFQNTLSNSPKSLAPFQE